MPEDGRQTLDPLKLESQAVAGMGTGVRSLVLMIEQ